MLLNVVHRTSYRYDQVLPYALQRVRLVPRSDMLQTVQEWRLDLTGAIEEVRFQDEFGNHSRLLSQAEGASEISITARGQVQTHDRNGVAGAHSGFAPLWLFLRETALTASDDALRDLAATAGGSDELSRLHELMAIISERVDYVAGATGTSTRAADALAAGSGVCQDHAHIFISACRVLGVPARYVSGYLLMDGVTDQVASHAWADAHVDGLGWVGFDVSNGISPDERYVRIATGRDYRDAGPVAGIRRGFGEEQLEVHITVEQ